MKGAGGLDFLDFIFRYIFGLLNETEILKVHSQGVNFDIMTIRMVWVKKSGS